MRKLSYPIGALVAFLVPSSALAATYQVGADKPYASLEALESVLRPGDVVEVDGDATYPGDVHIRPESAGTPEQPVIIRGIRKNGKRPVISGGTQWGIVLHNNHVVFEGFEVTAASGGCIINKANDITLRDVYIHDCPNQGILGMDSEAGDQTLEYVEVARCGNEVYDHQIYLATDETMFPGARIRIQHSYIHDGNGGNNIKSRAERNEIYGNWIEGPHYHVLDLIGVDGQDQDLAREDSDVVGNVLIQTGEFSIARMGGDMTGASKGRYRFAYNTIITSQNQYALFRMTDGIESLTVDNNLFLAPNGGSPIFLDTEEAAWTSGSPQISASNNFIQNGLEVPTMFAGTIAGADPLVTDLAGGDFVPAEGSPLVDKGGPSTGPAGFEIPSPLAVPTFVPPQRHVAENLQPIARPVTGTPDVGAYELGSDPKSPGGGIVGPGGGDGSGSDPAGVDDAGSEDSGGLDGEDRSWTMGESEGGGCSQSGIPPAGRNAAFALLALAFMSFGIRLPPRRRRARVSARR